jgi:hypothetical protein
MNAEEIDHDLLRTWSPAGDQYLRCSDCGWRMTVTKSDAALPATGFVVAALFGRHRSEVGAMFATSPT